MLFIGYSRCSTAKKARTWLVDNGVEFKERDIKLENPTEDELRKWHQLRELPIKRLFNTSGRLYKEMQLKDKLPNMTDDEKYALLATDGMLVKRPILVGDDFALFGFKEEEYRNVTA